MVCVGFVRECKQAEATRQQVRGAFGAHGEIAG